MNIRIIVVGKPRRDLASGILADYLKRTRRCWETEIIPVAEERLTSNRSERDVMAREAGRIAEKCPSGWPCVALDRKGSVYPSEGFADRLRDWQDSGLQGVAFAIGGPVGLDRSFVSGCAASLSFGPMTLPHDLALVLLTEQIYRAATIVRGWPLPPVEPPALTRTAHRYAPVTISCTAGKGSSARSKIPSEYAIHRP